MYYIEATPLPAPATVTQSKHCTLILMTTVLCIAQCSSPGDIILFLRLISGPLQHQGRVCVVFSYNIFQLAGTLSLVAVNTRTRDTDTIWQKESGLTQYRHRVILDHFLHTYDHAVSVKHLRSPRGRSTVCKRST